jgi:very-short-patch-repair endonuclease
LDLIRRRARDLRNNATDAERRLWRVLRGRQLGGFRFRRQVPIAGFIADFACPEARLIIEVDGEQHFENANYDASRSDALAAHGYRVVRYWNNDVMSKTEDVLADIQNKLVEQKLTPSQPPPSAARKGEG